MNKKVGKALEDVPRSTAASDESHKEMVGFKSSLPWPAVIGGRIDQEDNEADLPAAEVLRPPISRSKNEQGGVKTAALGLQKA